MAIMEQTLTILQSMDRRLLSVEKRMEEKTTDGGADHENGIRCRWSEDGKRSCYKVFPQEKTWSEARAHCQGLYHSADLVSIETHAEDLFLVYMTQEIQYRQDHFFTSGRKDASGVWIWRATGQPFTYTGWGTGEPNNYYQSGEDACGFANNILHKGENRRSVHWNDTPSSHKQGFISLSAKCGVYVSCYFHRRQQNGIN
ncbi:hypothetical protein LSAT2_025997 [Lamellibrachia satsuma]|nr:hypothetical protein LSAT2_025997 [Lamellibrachia satsuma]